MTDYLRKIEFQNNLKLTITQTERGFIWKEISFRFEGSDAMILGVQKLLRDFNRMNEF